MSNRRKCPSVSVKQGDTIHIVPEFGPERDMIVAHVEHHVITLIDTDPVERVRIAQEISDLRKRAGY